jgi:hypothetical protein
LRGPELVSTAEFNEKLGKSKMMTVQLPDGVAFINEEQTWTDKLFRKNLSRWARVPRDREAMHFLIVGDSGRANLPRSGSFSRRSGSAARRLSCTTLRWNICRSSITRHAATWC